MSARITTEIFIEKATDVHGNLYDYSKSMYTRAHDKVEIICRKHGSFLMSPSNHTHKTKPQGCPACAEDGRQERNAKAGAKRRGIPTRKPLNPGDFAAPIIRDLGMRQLKNREMRYVELECIDCGTGFEISCDNARRRKVDTCTVCKTYSAVCTCSVCGDVRRYMPHELICKPLLKVFCDTCKNEEEAYYSTIKEEGWTPGNITRFLVLKEGELYVKHTNYKVPQGTSDRRARVYGVKLLVPSVVWYLHTGDYGASAEIIDPELPIVPSNLRLYEHVGGFDDTKPGFLYYLKINGGELYKIGITNLSVEERFRVQDLKKIEVLMCKEFPVGYEARAEERRILKEYSEYAYTGIPILVSKGNTELFTRDILGLDV